MRGRTTTFLKPLPWIPQPLASMLTPTPRYVLLSFCPNTSMSLTLPRNYSEPLTLTAFLSTWSSPPVQYPRGHRGAREKTCQVLAARDGCSWYTDCVAFRVSFTSFKFMLGRDLEVNVITYSICATLANHGTSRVDSNLISVVSRLVRCGASSGKV